MVTKRYSRPDNVFCTENLFEYITNCDVLSQDRPTNTDHFLITTTLNLPSERIQPKPSMLSQAIQMFQRHFLQRIPNGNQICSGIHNTSYRLYRRPISFAWTKSSTSCLNFPFPVSRFLLCECLVCSTSSIWHPRGSLWKHFVNNDALVPHIL